MKNLNETKNKNLVMDVLKKNPSSTFNPLFSYVRDVQKQISASAAAVYVIHNDNTAGEWYSGRHHFSSSRKVHQDSRFNIFSARKSYIGLATAISLYEGKINSLDDELRIYLDDAGEEIIRGVTIRHLVTHTHGLELEGNRLVKEYPAGTHWGYNNAGLSLLYKIIKNTTGCTVADIIQEKVFAPLGFDETSWESEPSENLVYDILDEPEKHKISLEDRTGFERNLFVSARELAYWGYFHLKKGYINGTQVLPKEIFDTVTAIQTPGNMANIPLNGFFWFRNENNYEKSELGEKLPGGSYQILGKSGCTCLVIPKYNAVAVRMYNKIGNPPGYDYLRDIKNFGNLVAELFEG
ncbi:CubicO group peptidase (beta-lactamase class C family) [Scopulibacillus darangshiensis]|uniref:CubicO group peptidase (Beta-lactamase class C family) n=1 Tax=Scopulibacillus darangshiensis TaxID=442528 RepID=A0A4R2P4H1_9BACL|nr:serine hydrolase domain-containing protein [Scopulibacillus darangshiensis]TCP29710.1 CubicO group peptidase (beta-lactamase class C family) [Scopulibacillus darangshiensis]